jgi:hypothetical protein
MVQKKGNSMSGQWTPNEKQAEGTSCFPRILQEASGRATLREMVNQLLPDEVKIATVYVESLLKTRPIKDGLTPGYDHLHEENDWGVCRICAQRKVLTPDFPMCGVDSPQEREERAHMAVLELENDPR